MLHNENENFFRMLKYFSEDKERKIQLSGFSKSSKKLSSLTFPFEIFRLLFFSIIFLAISKNKYFLAFSLLAKKLFLNFITYEAVCSHLNLTFDDRWLVPLVEIDFKSAISCGRDEAQSASERKSLWLCLSSFSIMQKMLCSLLKLIFEVSKAVMQIHVNPITKPYQLKSE